MYQDLIVVIVDKYLSKDVMNVAKATGATGGTILYGRGAEANQKKKLFKVEIRPEQEVVLILSTREDTDKIVEAIDKEMMFAKTKRGKLLVLDIFEAIA